MLKKLSLGVAACCGILFTTQIASAKSSISPTLTLTEVSSTQLDWAWADGSGSGTWNTSTADNWDNTIASYLSSDYDSMTGYWREPGSLGAYNHVAVNFTPNVGLEVTVLSDEEGITPSSSDTYSDGETVPSDVGYYYVTFTDNASRTESVPDAGSSLLLLLLGLGGLGLLSCRVRSRQSA